MNPRPRAEALPSFYPDAFFGARRNPREVLLEQSESMQQKWLLLRDLRPGRILDIGCQKGEFLYFMQSRGWQGKGIEISPLSPNLFGQDIHYGSLAEAQLRPGSFDVVTLWAVLEHLLEPQRMLRDILPLLAPHGRLIVLVTNIQSLPGRWMRHDDIPRHLLLFSPQTLRSMLERCGWLVQRVHCNHVLFGGWHRGLFTYLLKWLAGESFADIVAQNRTPERWLEFTTHLRGKPSRLVEWVETWDKRLTPWFDTLMDRLGFGFTLIATATPRSPQRLICHGRIR
ncbi:MAG TPA: class I SAM-dependent methyltransferase [Candidatus Ozemobacteraceae bacterium]|nr:class I SAM-dependent methyltransferase [Candidatus Ozemobacteraceae bacterium]